MNHKQNIIPLKDLNLTSRFLFDEVMDDPQAHQDVLSIIFGKEIPLFDKAETEKELRVSPLIRSIRLDVFFIDEENVIYSTEMQAQKKVDLAKRSRYYQALIDTGLLKPGIPDYNLLNTSYIILITPFDLFGYGKYQYTFEARCREVPECILEDKATRIFLNTRGTNDDEVSQELVDFLHYLENTTASVANASDSERIHRIHERVHKVKLSEEIGVKYMQAWEEKYFEREEGREEGLKEGYSLKLKDLIKKKLLKGKSPEIIADEVEEELDTVLTIIQEITTEDTISNHNN
ncbi:Rpn family recombination-promoting nuclease/putative transposase [Roseburia hominis]